MNSNDVIAAISTSLTPGGIGILRISGEGAPRLCAPLTRIRGISLEQAQPNHLYYGKVVEQGEVLDEALITVMRGPRSYTGEDTVELQCHGGPLVLERVLEAVLRAGARIAEPGEFTKRAFLNGRLDLSEAEAVMDLIGAGSELARETAMKQLQGVHSARIRDLRSRILHICAGVEAALDDPEHFESGVGPEVHQQLKSIYEEISELLRVSDQGRVAAEGIRTAIVGRPNVGKSSLLNRLLGFERAIVTEIPGTTRDTIEESFRYEDVTLRLFDTAGIHSSQDAVEKIGIERARTVIRQADLVLLLIDGSQKLTEGDEALRELIIDKKALLLINKSDLEPAESAELLAQRFHLTAFPISARTGEGLSEVMEEIRRLFFLEEIRQQPVLMTSLRHKELLMRGQEALSHCLETLENRLPEDFLTIDLMEAYQALGLIIGEEAGEDLINEIFSQFCMGK